MEHPNNKNYFNWNYLILGVAFLSFGNILLNDFALDDYGLLISNSLTESGISGIGKVWQCGYRSSLEFKDLELYRPIPRTLFQVYYSLAPGKAILPHFVSLLLYCISNVLLFRLLCRFFTGPVAALISLVFLTHPLHTEVVANAKGIEELLSFLFLLLTASKLLDSSAGNSVKNLGFAAVFFFAALCSKESASAFLFILPLIQILLDGKWKKGFIQLLVLAVPFVLFLAFRIQAIGIVSPEIQVNENFLVSLPNWGSRFINALYLLTIYLKKIFTPVQLSCDGSYALFKPISECDFVEIAINLTIPMILLVLIGKFGLKSRYSFGLLFFGLSIFPVSNIPFLIGTNYAERLLFIPLLGVLISIVELLKHQSLSPTHFLNKFEPFKQKQQLLILTAVLLLVLLSVNRNADWKNNLTLFSSDIINGNESARLNAYYSSALTDQKYLTQLKSDVKRLDAIQTALTCYQKSIHVLPKQKRIRAAMATLHQSLGNNKLADSLFKEELKINPNSAEVLNLYGNFLFQSGKVQNSKPYFYHAIQQDPLLAAAWVNLGSVIGTEGKEMLEDSTTSSTPNADPVMKNRFDSALVCYQMAIKINPLFPEPYLYSFKVYRMMGELKKASVMQEKFEQLNQQKIN